MPTMMEPSKAHPVQPASAIARTFRFGAWLKSLESPSACAELAQRAERLGYSTVFVGEHLDTGYGPFAMATALASATSLLRVGTLMLLNDLRHPAILAKEAAALDVLSGGRLELGIGAGWKDTDYTSIGLCMPRGPVRVQQPRESTLRSPDQSRSSVHHCAAAWFEPDES
jgi:alkanesulfonate monooxygenase SsuD/methylene tetrahydromethanopterin reductase-like flavin-dependent oxidoreductase (luciferase family)